MIRVKNATLPGEWTTGIGEGHGNGGYTHWYYHPDYEIEAYHDPGHDHVVNLYEVLGETDDGDVDIGEYPKKSRRFSSRDDAEEYTRRLMREVSE